MLRKRASIWLVFALSLVLAVSVLADAPAEGLVVEGESVPGIALGFSRVGRGGLRPTRVLPERLGGRGQCVLLIPGGGRREGDGVLPGSLWRWGQQLAG
jgi:hypothetical protein